MESRQSMAAIQPFSIGAATPDTFPITADQRRWLSRHDLLLPLLRKQIIAAAVKAIALSEQDRQAAFQGWCRCHGIGSEAELDTFCHQRGLSRADAAWQAELPSRIEAHCREHFAHRSENHFLARKHQLDEVVYSLLRVREASLARELYLRIAEGEADFAELAASHAMGPEQRTRGVIGPVPLIQAHPALAELLRSSQPGQLRLPLRIDSWWLVVRLEALRPACFDAATELAMARELFEAWVEESVRQQLPGLSILDR
ncbi:peptidylprolyl isomerase [Synechococcus sp. CS-1325]|uniref:peptidylprolyl isomerase n=1 Tax=Synechococcus sp. CS-1325 TaxID=2847979 RepID=UPI00223C2C65|nr:peptidylprolyl isomerase [Synechococcus sp. CS-1325]MCT0198809.1 peptidylprolyl isomerase [Synechococcus sp. CS-1325]